MSAEPDRADDDGDLEHDDLLPRQQPELLDRTSATTTTDAYDRQGAGQRNETSHRRRLDDRRVRDRGRLTRELLQNVLAMCLELGLGDDAPGEASTANAQRGTRYNLSNRITGSPSHPVAS